MPSSEGAAAAGRAAQEGTLLARHVYDLTRIGRSDINTNLSFEMARCWPAVNSSAVPLHLRLEGCYRARDLMRESFSQRGSRRELEWGIRFARYATGVDFLTIITSADRVKCFYVLCEMCLAMFKLDGNIEALNESVTRGREGKELACGENLPELLPPTSLGDAFMLRFERFHENEDLEDAILLDRQGINHTAIDSLERWQYQANLITRLLLREPYAEHVQSRREALDLISILLYHLPRGHTLQDTVLKNLASIIGPTKEEEGFWIDSDGPINLCKRALETAAQENPHRAGILTNLAAMYATKFDETEEIEFLLDAVRYSKDAKDIVTNDNPWRLKIQRRYAEQLKLRADATGCVADLEEAVEEIKGLLQGTNEDDQHRSLYLKILTCLTVSRFAEFRLPQDLVSICDALKLLCRRRNIEPEFENSIGMTNRRVVIPLHRILDSADHIPSPHIVPTNPQLRPGEEKVNTEVWERMVGAWYSSLQSALCEIFDDDAIIPSLTSFFNSDFKIQLVFEANTGYDIRRLAKGFLRSLPGAASLSYRRSHWLHLCDLSLRKTPLDNVQFLVHMGRVQHHDSEERYSRFVLELSEQARRRKTLTWLAKAQNLGELAAACVSPNLTAGIFAPAVDVQGTGVRKCDIRAEALGVTAGFIRCSYLKTNDGEDLELAKRYVEVAWRDSRDPDEILAFEYALILKEKHMRTGEPKYLQNAVERAEEAMNIAERNSRVPSSEMFYELGILLRWTYMVNLDLETLNRSITKLQQALNAADYNAEKCLICNALAVNLVYRGRRYRRVEDLNEAIVHCQAVVDNPRGADMLALHYTAANVYSVRTEVVPTQPETLQSRIDDFEMASYHMKHADRLDSSKDPSRLADFALIMVSKYRTTQNPEDANLALGYVRDALDEYDVAHSGRRVALHLLVDILHLPAVSLRVEPFRTRIVGWLQEVLDSSDCPVVSRVKAGDMLTQYQTLDERHFEYYETLKKIVTLLAENFGRLRDVDRAELAEIIGDLPGEVAGAAFRMGISNSGVIWIENQVRQLLSLPPSAASMEEPNTNDSDAMEL